MSFFYFFSFLFFVNSEDTLNGPRGIFKDKQGNLFICDGYNNRIMKYSHDGQVSQVNKGTQYVFSFVQNNKILIISVIVDFSLIFFLGLRLLICRLVCVFSILEKLSLRIVKIIAFKK